MSYNGKKLLLIGLDGATFYVLDWFVGQGIMPGIGKLIREGVSRPLRSTIPPITPVAWTSFMTGKNPGKHGIFDFRLYDTNTRNDMFANSRLIRARTLWQILSDAGVRVGVINLPMTYPPYPVNGFLVSGFDTPSLNSKFTYPAEIRDDLLDRFPDYTFVVDGRDDLHDSNTHFISYTEAVQRAFRVRTEAALYLAGKYTPDVFMVHYQCTDALQHYLWCYVDPELAESQSPTRREAVIKCYQELDRGLSSLMEYAREHNADILMVSDHGFGPAYGILYPNVWLEQWGYLYRRLLSTNSDKTFKSYFRDSRFRIIRILYRHLAKIKTLIQRRCLAFTKSSTPNATWIENVQRTTLQNELPLDWDRTVALVASAEQSGSLYLHNIEDQAEKQRLLAELETRFRELVDPQDNLRWFREVLRGEVAYHPGQENVRIPDLVLVPREGWNVSRQLMKDGVWQANLPWWGTHRPDGILIAAGPNIQTDNIEQPSLIDIAPTILYFLGLPVPNDMDGHVLTSLFSINSPVVYTEGETMKENPPRSALSMAEEALIEERLRGLGYLE